MGVYSRWAYFREGTVVNNKLGLLNKQRMCELNAVQTTKRKSAIHD